MLTTGVDFIEIDRIAGALSRYGDRFLRRIFTPGEIAYCRGRAPNLAARFAAKEAVMKSLAPGFAAWAGAMLRWCALQRRAQPTAARAGAPPGGTVGRNRNRHQSVPLPGLCDGGCRGVAARHRRIPPGRRRDAVGRPGGATGRLAARYESRYGGADAGAGSRVGTGRGQH